MPSRNVHDTVEPPRQVAGEMANLCAAGHHEWKRRLCLHGGQQESGRVAAETPANAT